MTVGARAFLQGQFDIRGYPYRYIAFIDTPSWWLTEGVPVVLAAADYAAQWGWELVSVLQVGKTIYAVMRR
jgi:hypothetical protein